MLDKFKEERLHVLKGKRCNWSVDNKVKLLNSKESSTRLIKPKDKLVPWESHIRQFGNPKSNEHKKRGHKVVVMTHAYDERSGVRWMTGGLKVYYVPMLPFYNKNTFPILWGCFPIFRDIVLRERIDIVHCHQAFSTIAHEAIMHAGTMGCHTVFTDHSLFGFRDASGILMNKLLKFTLSNISHVICVSHICMLHLLVAAFDSERENSRVNHTWSTNGIW